MSCLRAINLQLHRQIAIANFIGSGFTSQRGKGNKWDPESLKKFDQCLKSSIPKALAVVRSLKYLKVAYQFPDLVFNSGRSLLASLTRMPFQNLELDSLWRVYYPCRIKMGVCSVCSATGPHHCADGFLGNRVLLLLFFSNFKLNKLKNQHLVLSC